MAFGNFWRGGGRERFGGERDRDPNRDRWRSAGGYWRDEDRERDMWRDNERYGASDRDRDEYGSRGSGVDYYERPRGYGSEGYGSRAGGQAGQDYGSERYRRQGHGGYGPESGRSWGSEQRERDNDYQGSQYGSSEYDYRGGSLYGGGYGRNDFGGQRQTQGPGTFRGRGPRGYRRSDERIREDVCDCLTDDPQLDASNLEVTVKECEVTLSGIVNRREDKRRAEDLVESISGVKDVRNNLRVSNEQIGERMSGQSAAGQTTQTQGQPGQQTQTGQSPRH